MSRTGDVIITVKNELIIVTLNIKNLAPCGTDGRHLLSGFQLLVTSTLDQVIWHTVVHHSSTSIYIPNFTEIGKKLFCGRTNRWDRTKFKVT